MNLLQTNEGRRPNGLAAGVDDPPKAGVAPRSGIDDVDAYWLRTVGRPVREPPIGLALALFAAALAVVFMRLLGTPVLDLAAYRIGVLVATLSGLVTGVAVRVLRTHPRRRRLAWAIVPFAGAAVGMAVQGVLLARVPEYRTYMLASGITTQDPWAWVLVGAPLGALPALVAAAVIALALRVVGRSAHDDRERVMLPFAGACALVGAFALGAASAEELPIAGGVVLLALLSLVGILVSDIARSRWLRGIFAGTNPSFEIVDVRAFGSAEDVPAVVGAAPSQAVIVRTLEEQGYRGAARTAVAATARHEFLAVLPLRRRRAVLIALFAATPVFALVATLMR